LRNGDRFGRTAPGHVTVWVIETMEVARAPCRERWDLIQASGGKKQKLNADPSDFDIFTTTSARYKKSTETWILGGEPGLIIESGS